MTVITKQIAAFAQRTQYAHGVLITMMNFIVLILLNKLHVEIMQLARLPAVGIFLNWLLEPFWGLFSVYVFFITCIVVCIIWCCTSCCRERRNVYIVPSVSRSFSETQQQPLLANSLTPSNSDLGPSPSYYPPPSANSINSSYNVSGQQPGPRGMPFAQGSRVPQQQYQPTPTLSSQQREPPYNPEGTS